MKSDFLVIGSGIAGLTFAIQAAKHGTVTVLTKGKVMESNTAWAQGGIAGVLPEGLRELGDNIDSHTVAETDHASHLSRITIVTTGTPAVIEQIKAQLGRLVPIHDVHDLTVEGAHLERELALIKVVARGEPRVEALRMADLIGARVVDVTLESFVFEIARTSEEIDAFINLMRPLGLTEITRTGVCAMARGTGATNGTAASGKAAGGRS